MLRDFPDQKQRAAVCYRQSRLRKGDDGVPTRLVKLNITKVSLVPRGACPEAHVMLYKSADLGPTSDSLAVTSGPPDGVSTTQDVGPLTTPSHTVVPKEDRLMGIDRSKLTKEEVEYLDVLESKSPPVPDKEEDITKELPDAVKKMLDAQAEQIKKATERAEAAEKAAAVEKEARERAEFAKRADVDIPHIPGTSNEKGDVLYAVSKAVDTKTFDALVSMLKAGDAALRASGEESGSDTPVTGTAYEKLTTLAKELVKSGRAKTEPEGFDLALRENPDLYSQYRQEHSRRVYVQ